MRPQLRDNASMRLTAVLAAMHSAALPTATPSTWQVTSIAVTPCDRAIDRTGLAQS